MSVITPNPSLTRVLTSYAATGRQDTAPQAAANQITETKPEHKLNNINNDNIAEIDKQKQKQEDELITNVSNTLNNGKDLSIDGFLDDISKNKDMQIAGVQTVIDKNQNQLDAYNKFDQMIKDFQKASESLLFSNNSIKKNATTNVNTDSFFIEPNSSAPSGSFDLTVEQLAASQKLNSHELTGTKTQLGDPNIPTRTLTIKLADGKSFDIELTKEQTTPLAISKAINAANKGVTARVIPDGENKSYLSISPAETGTKSAITEIKVTDDAQLNTKLEYSAATTSPATGMTELQPAKDAIIVIDGIRTTHQKNIIEANQVLEGTQITLLTSSTTPVTVNIEEDNSAFVENAVNWIGLYNQIKAFYDSATRMSDDPEKAGPLGNNNALSNLMRSISDIMSKSFGTGAISNLHDIQFEKTLDGQIKLKDAEKFKTTVLKNMSEFKQLFIGNDEHKGLAGEIKAFVDRELDNRGTSQSSALQHVQNRLNEENRKLKDKIKDIEATTIQKINVLKIKFSHMQEAITRFKDAENHMKLMSRSGND